MKRRVLEAGFVAALISLCAGPAKAQFPFPSPFDFGRPGAPQTEADIIRQQADAAYQKGSYKEVVAITDPLIAADPNDYASLYLRASAKIEMGRNTRSNAQIRDGIADSRQSLAVAGARFAWLYVPYFYGLTSLSELEKRVEHADVGIAFASSLLGRPDIPPADRAAILYQRALALTAKKELKGAIEDYTEAIRLTPNHLGAHIKRSEAFAALGQSKQALASYDAALEAFPNSLLVYNDRGSYRRTLGNLDEAVGDFTRALQIDPRFAVGYINRGIALTELNQPQAAESDFSQALVLDPAQQWVLGLRGAARLAQGHAALAIDDYSRLLKLNPKYAGYYAERGFAYFAARNYAVAAADFEKALQLGPSQSRLVSWQYAALLRAGQGEAAKAALDKVINAKTTPTSDAWAAQICRFLGDVDTEQQLLEAAKSQNPRQQSEHLCEAQFFIGEKKLAAGEGDPAREHFKASAKTNSFHLSAYRCARYELGELK